MQDTNKFEVYGVTPYFEMKIGGLRHLDTYSHPTSIPESISHSYKDDQQHCHNTLIIIIVPLAIVMLIGLH